MSLSLSLCVEMESKAEESIRTRMESLRMACNREISLHQQKTDAFMASSRESLLVTRARGQETLQCQGKVLELKAKLREADDELVKALSVKTRKEAKRMALMDSIAARKAKVEELKRTVQDQITKRDEYAELLSRQSLEYEETGSQNNTDEIQEAISWYNRVLGFYIEGGHGVKFTFKNISSKNPNDEFSFTIRHADDTYTLLDCDLQLNDIEELINELNKTNGLFKFVRSMRQKFQEAAAQGFFPLSTNLSQVSSTISSSAPVMSISTDRSESLAKKSENQTQHGEVDKHYKKLNNGNASKAAVLSPGSASSLRRSSRFKPKK